MGLVGYATKEPPNGMTIIYSGLGDNRIHEEVEKIDSAAQSMHGTMEGHQFIAFSSK